MRAFIFPLMGGLAVGFGWMALWAACLHAFGIPVLARSVAQTAARKERLVAMGKWRYVLIFGVLGNGMGFGLATGVANMIRTPQFGGLIGVATQIVISTLLVGLWNGIATWNDSIRGEVPFPPQYPPQK